LSERKTKRIILLTVLRPGQYGLGIFSFTEDRETISATSLLMVLKQEA